MAVLALSNLIDSSPFVVYELVVLHVIDVSVAEQSNVVEKLN